MLTEDGQVIDWKKKFKVKKLEGLKKAQRILELSRANESLEKELHTKNITIQRMADNGLTEYSEKKRGEITINFGNTSKLEVEIKRLETTNKALKDDFQFIESSNNSLVKENKDLRDKVSELYNRLRNNGNFSHSDASHMESLVAQENELEVQMLKFISLEKENRHNLKLITEKQNAYESMIQENNIQKNDLKTLQLELERQTKKADSLNSILVQKDQRIQTLTNERVELNMKLKDLEINNLKQIHSQGSNQNLEILKAENDLFRKLLSTPKISQQNSNDIATLKKQNIDNEREIDSLKQKIYSYKQMLKEYEILLSIFKDSEKRDSNLDRLNQAVDIDDVKIEDLMNKIKHHIELCIQQVKVTFLDSQSQSVNEMSDKPALKSNNLYTNDLMQDRVKELNQEKQSLLTLLNDQESLFKSNIGTNSMQVDKLKEALAKALDDRKNSEAKIGQLEQMNNETQLKMKELQQQCEDLTKDLDNKLQDKDLTIDTLNNHISEAQEEIQRLQLANQDEKEDLQRQKRQVQTEIMNVENEVKNLRDQIIISNE